LKHLGQLNARSFHLNIRVLEAIRERERMQYFASCWDVAIFERLKDVAAFDCEASKNNFRVVEQELRMVLDVVSQRLSSSCEPLKDGRLLDDVCENNRRCIRRADDVLASVKHSGNLTEKCLAGY
jgi:hypothetical protein